MTARRMARWSFCNPISRRNPGADHSPGQPRQSGSVERCAHACADGNCRDDRRRHGSGARRDPPFAAPLFRSARRGGGGQRQSRQPFALADALAGAGIYHQPEHGKARLRSPELHHGRAGLWVLGADKRSKRRAESPRTRWRKTPTSPSRFAGWLARHVRRVCDCLDRSSGNARSLIRQRFRWTFGTLQSFWKHSSTLFRAKYGALGWVALPNIFVFQIALPLISPVIDLLFLGSLLLWVCAVTHHADPAPVDTADVQRSVSSSWDS